MLVDIEGFRADEIRADPGTSVLLLSDQPVAEAFFVLDGELTLGGVDPAAVVAVRLAQ